MTDTEQKLRDIIEGQNAVDDRLRRVADTVAAELEGWNGRKLTARAATNLEKATGWTVRLTVIGDMRHVEVWGGDLGTTHGERISLIVSYGKPDPYHYHGDPNGDSRSFCQLNPGTFKGVDDRRARRRAQVMGGGPFYAQNLAKAIDAFLDAREGLRRELGEHGSIDVPDRYEIEKAFGI